MAKIHLSLAIGAYDHVRDLLDGSVQVAGVELTVLRLPVEEMFYRFLMHGEFDVSEASLAKIVALAAQDDQRFVPLPVFPSRVFRHSSIFVRSDGAIARPEDLAGKRVGVPEWAQTAAIYTRGLLAHEYGVDLASIHWHQAGVNEPGRIEKVKLSLPSGVRLTVIADPRSPRCCSPAISMPCSRRVHRRRFSPAIRACGGCSPTLGRSSSPTRRRPAFFPSCTWSRCGAKSTSATVGSR